MTTLASPDSAPSDLLLPGYWPGPAGSWRTLPDFDESDLAVTSLAWGVIEWCESRLLHHLTGDPWRFTRGQLAFLLRWYAVDERGRFLYRRGVRRGAKGTGKDPFGAAWCMGELAGPVRYSHHDEHGRPVGVPHRLALVQIAANSQAQASDVLRVANAMASDALRDEVGLDTGITRTQTSTGSRIELLTASESSSEGDPATAILLNETHHMTESNGGAKIAAVAQRNVGKSPRELQARLLSLTNAHRQGSDSRAEVDFEAWQAQVSGKTRTGKQDILYDSIEAPPDVDMTDADDLKRGIVAAYSDAPWADIERLCDEANDPATSVADLIRFYLNGLASAEDSWIEDSATFDAFGRPDELLTNRDQLAMFLDCSKSGDATGLVASRLSDGHVITLGEWHAPTGWNARKRGPWRAPKAEVDAVVRSTFRDFDVVWFGVDPSPAKDDDADVSYWMPLVDDWHRDFKDTVAVWATPGAKGNAVLFDMRLSQPGARERMRLFTAQAMQTVADVDGPDGETPEARQARLAAPPFTHDGHPTLRVHVQHARRRPNQWGVSLGKVTRDSTDLVDLAVCMVGALLGRRLALNSGKTTKRKRTGVVW